MQLRENILRINVCVAIEGFVLYIGGDYSCTLNVMLLVQYVSASVIE